MNNLHDLPQSFTPESFTLWFWMKAGLGMALGFFLLFVPLWIVIVFGGLGVLGAVLGLGSHR